MQQTLGHAPQQQPGDRDMAATSHYDQVCPGFPSDVSDLMGGLRSNVAHDLQIDAESLGGELCRQLLELSLDDFFIRMNRQRARLGARVFLHDVHKDQARPSVCARCLA
jgi:hypothetical protein